MKIVEHRLFKHNDTPYPFSLSPNRGPEFQPVFVVMHYSAGPGAPQTVSWLTDPASRASAHLVIGRDGSITQLVPFNIQAWHAGTSEWESYTGLNQYAIGIELDNAGKLEKQGNRWRAWFGQEYNDSDVLEATHKFEHHPAGWHIFTPLQIQSALDVCLVLAHHYGIRDILGHDDIAPNRKIDPGPAFPMHSFRSRVLGRWETEPRLYQSTTALNIRSGPDADQPLVDGGPLPKGTRVEILDIAGRWRFVDVADSVNGINDLQGWVHGHYLQPLS